MSANIADLNEVNCLEYGFLKVPYELLNKKFRASQKTIDQYNYYFKKEVASLESKLREKTGPLALTEVAEDVQKLYSRIANFQTEMERSTGDEIEAAESLFQRADYLKEGTSTSPIALECFKKQRINRFITDHLLRAGYFATAQRLWEYAGTDDNFHCNKFIFHVAKQVEDSLARKDLSICLNWILDNRSKLHRLNSTFETEVRIQQCAELIRNGRRLDAINYSKQFFGHLPVGQWKEGNLLSLFGLLGLGVQKSIPNESYQRLLSDERYDSLVDMFRRENQRIFQAGIAAHKTPYCKRRPGSKCVVCNDLHDLAEGLPVAHASNSRLICAVSGEPLNEENQPMMLPNGRVYGEKSIRRLTKDREICCPRTNEVFSIDDVKRAQNFLSFISPFLGNGLSRAPPPPEPAPAPSAAAGSLGQFSSLLNGAVPQGGGGGAGGAANAAQTIMAAFSNSGGGNNPFGELLSLGSAIGGAPPPPPPGPPPPDLPSLPIPTFAPATPPTPALTWPSLPSTTVQTPSPATAPPTPLPFQRPPPPTSRPLAESRPAPDYYDGQPDSAAAPPPPPEKFRDAAPLLPPHPERFRRK